jgi:hypothetical protein
MAQSYKKYFQDYLTNLPIETTRVYRYEDVIFKKMEWLEDMLLYLDIEVSISNITEIANRYDIRPDIENPHKHIRQIVPGNYKTHLTPATINELNRIFKPIMNFFQYDSVMSMTLNPETNIKKMIGPNNFPANEIKTVSQRNSWSLTRPLRELISSFKK